METLKKPIWLFLFNILPQLLVVFLFYEAYQIFESLLDKDQKQYWVYGAAYILGINTLWLFYVIYLILSGKEVGIIPAWIILLVNITTISLYFTNFEYILPSNLPGWMFTSSDLEIYPYSFVVPGALYGLILLVISFTPSPREMQPWMNIIPAVMIPLCMLFFAYVAGGFFFEMRIKYIGTYILVALTCLFLFYLIRFAYIIAMRNEDRDSAAFIIKVLVVCIFPILGLLFNGGFFEARGGIFGDFNHPIFYILALLNGVLLCIPDSKSTAVRWLVFIARSILFTYILYFFTVFIPYLPLAVLAIIAIGFGFLMLTPILVFVYQVRTLKDDIEFLSGHLSKPLVYIVFFISLAVIPSVITLSYKADRHELDRVLATLYNRDYKEEAGAEFNERRIQRLLDHVASTKNRMGYHLPFLDSYYSWLVLDNLLLSDKKIGDIESIIVGGSDGEPEHTFRRWGWFNFPPHRAVLDTTIIESEQMPDGNWKSFVHLKVSNPEVSQNEYRCYIEVPDDCFITNYYLEIEGKREYGILAEKKSANWVYNNIVKTRRDPGILQTVSPGKYILKVFPVDSSTQRVTGIEFVHHQPVQIKIDTLALDLGTGPVTENKPAELLNGRALYIPSSFSGNLAKQRRQAEYHFIIDCSVHNTMDTARVKFLLNKYGVSLNLNYNDLNIWGTNYTDKRIRPQQLLADIAEHDNKGGFYPEYLMRRIMANNYNAGSDRCPVFIMLSSDPANAAYLKDFSELQFAYPDMQYFFAGTYSNELDVYDLLTGEFLRKATADDLVPDTSVHYTWKEKRYTLAKGVKAHILLDGEPVLEGKNKWEEGVAMNSLVRNYILNPNLEERWLQIVKASMKSGIISPFTSYISLENEAQKKALLHKQEQVLESKEQFDLEEVQNMSEPSAIWYLLVFIVIAALVKFRGSGLG